MSRDKLHESIRIHEGLSLKPYRDTQGHLSIGFGKNLDEGITIQQAYDLLDSDIDIAMSELDRAVPSWTMHSEARQDVLVEMAFNLGMPRLLGFKKMWAALEAKDYDKAAKEMQDSRWADQTGHRAVTLAMRMREGKWA